MAHADGTAAPVRGPAGAGAVRFARLPGAALAALVNGDLARASAAAGVALTPFFVTPEAVLLWRLRLHQITADPASARWIARAAVAEPDGAVVGHAGFHGPPDAAGMVEVGYAVDPTHRRRGYATAMLGGLLRRAAAEPGVRTVRATIRPDNSASLATIARFGFTRNGEQWDEEDGLELVFDRSAGWPGAEQAHLARVPSLRKAGRPGADRMIATEVIRMAAVLAAGHVAAGDGDAVPRVGEALLAAFDAAGEPGVPAASRAFVVPPPVTNGPDAVGGRAGQPENSEPGPAGAPRVEVVTHVAGGGTGVVVWGSAGDVAAAAGAPVPDVGGLLCWARREAFGRVYAGVPESAAAAMRVARDLEVVLLLDPGTGGGLWVDLDPAAQAPAAILLVEMTLRAGGEAAFRVVSS